MQILVFMTRPDTNFGNHCYMVTQCVFSFKSLINPSFSHSAQGVIGFKGEKVRVNSFVLFFCQAELSLTCLFELNRGSVD